MKFFFKLIILQIIYLFLYKYFDLLTIVSVQKKFQTKGFIKIQKQKQFIEKSKHKRKACLLSEKLWQEYWNKGQNEMINPCFSEISKSLSKSSYSWGLQWKIKYMCANLRYWRYDFHCSFWVTAIKNIFLTEVLNF